LRSRHDHSGNSQAVKLYWNEPFQPIELESSSGRSLTIRDRGHFRINAVTGRIAYADVIENFDLIDLDHIKGDRLLEAVAQTA